MEASKQTAQLAKLLNLTLPGAGCNLRIDSQWNGVPCVVEMEFEEADPHSIFYGDQAEVVCVWIAGHRVGGENFSPAELDSWAADGVRHVVNCRNSQRQERRAAFAGVDL